MKHLLTLSLVVAFLIPSIAEACCKICHQGKACGDTCIAIQDTCRVGPGCACDGVSEPMYAQMTAKHKTVSGGKTRYGAFIHRRISREDGTNKVYPGRLLHRSHGNSTETIPWFVDCVERTLCLWDPLSTCYQDTDWQYTAPGTVGDYIRTSVCAKANPEDED